ncbi:hypothetical protein JTB14_036614 [Gonioctena quinquepunctata]|nr:hypothetical protein JTB14_036614 [Gonioctena quinquepunctata]
MSLPPGPYDAVFMTFDGNYTMSTGSAVAISGIIGVFFGLYGIFVYLRKRQSHAEAEDDASSSNISQIILVPHICINENQGPGPYQIVDPLPCSPVDLDNLAPPLYQRTENMPSVSSIESPPDYHAIFAE